LAITNEDGIITPDEENTLDPEVYLAAMASSISQGIGVRLTAQEQAIGLKAGIPAGTTAAYLPDLIAPFEVLASDGCYTQGLDLSGGVATVTVAGMYLFTASASLESVANESSNTDRTIALQTFLNGEQLTGCEVSSTTGHWATASTTTTARCVPGDTLYVKWYSAGPGAGAGAGVLSPNTSMNSLSIVLITPVAPAE
jgi:hypothetical protein